jgi:hypothetical protein
MPFPSILCWAFFASYVVHVLDETLLNGGFVKWIVDNFWPTYHGAFLTVGPTVLFPRIMSRRRPTP